MPKVKIDTNLPVIFFKENKHYIVYTPALDLSTCGKTKAQAEKRFNEIVNIFFEDIIESGTLRQVLLSYGWRERKKQKNNWEPPQKFISGMTQPIAISM